MAEYDAMTVLWAVVNTTVWVKPSSFDVSLLQGKVKIEPYHTEFLKTRKITIPDSDKKDLVTLKKQVEELEKNQNKTASAVKDGAAKAPTKITIATEIQFYFDDAEFNPEEPYVIKITDSYGGERLFNVRIKSIK